MVGHAPHSPHPAWAQLAPHTRGLGVCEGQPGLGHPSHVSLVLFSVEAGQVAQGEESFTLQVVGPQHVVVKHGQQQTGPLLPALLRGDQAEGSRGSSHPTPLAPGHSLPRSMGSHSSTLTQTPQSSGPQHIPAPSQVFGGPHWGAGGEIPGHSHFLEQQPHGRGSVEAWGAGGGTGAPGGCQPLHTIRRLHRRGDAARSSCTGWSGPPPRGTRAGAPG